MNTYKIGIKGSGNQLVSKVRDIEANSLKEAKDEWAKITGEDKLDTWNSEKQTVCGDDLVVLSLVDYPSFNDINYFSHDDTLFDRTCVNEVSDFIVYVAGPYRGKSKFYLLNRYQRFRNAMCAWKVSVQLWNMNVMPFCPHMNSFWMDKKVNNLNVFIEGDLKVLKRCDAILMLKGWENSEGVLIEIKFAKENNIPIFYDVDSLREFIKNKKS